MNQHADEPKPRTRLLRRARMHDLTASRHPWMREACLARGCTDTPGPSCGGCRSLRGWGCRTLWGPALGTPRTFCRSCPLQDVRACLRAPPPRHRDATHRMPPSPTRGGGEIRPFHFPPVKSQGPHAGTLFHQEKIFVVRSALY